MERQRRTGRHLSPAAVSGAAGSSSTFPAFPEIGTVRDSRNFRNEPGGVGGVETGWDIKVSVVEWCYRRTLFLGLHAGGKKGEGRQAEFCTFVHFPQFSRSHKCHTVGCITHAMSLLKLNEGLYSLNLLADLNEMYLVPQLVEEFDLNWSPQRDITSSESSAIYLKINLALAYAMSASRTL